jgi:peptidoglycan hydrolase-like protein with peptidoglycan-binding domain
MGNEATRIKTQIGEDLLLLNDDNIATFNINATPLLKAPFEQGGLAAQEFKGVASAQIDEIRTHVNTATSDTTREFDTMIANATTSTNTFSDTVEGKLTGAVASAQAHAQKMDNYLTYPWRNGEDAVNTWSGTVENAYSKAVKTAQDSARAINEANASIKPPSYTTDTTPAPAPAPTPKPAPAPAPAPTTKTPPAESVKALQNVLNMLFSSGLTVDGKFGSATKTALTTAQRTMNRAISTVNMNGMYTKATQQGMITWIDNKIRALKSNGTGSSALGQGIQRYNTIKKMIPAAFHAKGTLGTKQDEWAYTDEPWLGDEIVLVPGANGNLSYMRKGTAVMPADISANLVEWGKINPDMTALANGVQGVNLMSNYVSKPEIKLNIDNFLRCDNVTQDSLPELKKFVNEQMNSLVKQLNYGLKRSGA